MTGCTVDGCGGKHKGRGYCHKHLQRLKRLGTTELPAAETAEDRFWKRFERTETCWLWKAGTTKFGYGVVNQGGRGVPHLLAHRLSWELHYGPIPPGQQVCHRCDIPACVNPEHLFLGTNADNLRDMREKGRGHDLVHYRGSKNPAARLTEDDVRVIKARLARGERTIDVARDYPVGRTAIDWIANGRTWIHVEASDQRQL